MPVSLSQAVENLKESLAALSNHKASLNDVATTAELRTVKTDAAVLQVQLWWTRVPSTVANEFLWDYLEIDVEENLQAVLTALQEVVPLAPATQSVEIIRRKNFGHFPLLDVHPQRFRAMHALGKVLASEVQDGFGFSQRVLDRALRTLMESQREKGRCLRYQISNTDSRGFAAVAQLGSFYADFHSCGRNIFKFPSELIEMFKRTDVEDITLDSLQFPYRTFYLAFGPQRGLEVEPGWVVDGAYVNNVGDGQAIQFALTCAPTDPNGYEHCNERYEPTFIQAMDREQMKIGVGEAADLVFADKVNELRNQVSGQREFPDLMDGIKDATSKFAQAELSMIDQKFAAWKGALRLVINGLAYVSAYPEDIENRWPEGTPQKLYLQTQDGNHKQKRKALSELAAMGYTEIRLCGRSVRNQVNSAGRELDDSSLKKATWVRGHWLRQPYGAGRALRRLQWRRPVLRNAEAAQGRPDEGGHIYHVE